ncbi:MAG: polysaccharide pyruvyl transferase CsaB [Thermostichus sp. DG_1_6_bins_120]
MKLPRVLICGYYGYGNGGDEALLLALLQQLQQLSVPVQPVVLSRQPAQTAATYSVLACPRFNGLALQRCLREAKAFVWGGGSLLQDRTSWRSPLYYLGVMGLAQQLKLKTFAWAQGIGPLDRGWIRYLARHSLAGCTAVSVRDKVTSALLENWGIPHQVAPDPVWGLTAKRLPEWDSWPQPRIAVVLRQHPHLTPARLEAISQGLRQLQASTGAYFLFIPFQLAPQGSPDLGADYRLAQDLQQRMPGHSQILEIRDPCLLKGSFRGVSLVITMRYHGLVMAAAEGCRCFGLSYDPKVRALLQELHMPGWELETFPTEVETLHQHWLACYEQGLALTPADIQAWVRRSARHGDLLRQHLT